MKFLYTFMITVCFTLQVNASPRGIIIPRIEGDTLFINGAIGSHIYDYFSYEYKALKTVKQVSLNSFGGNHDWALIIAEKIQSYGFKTKVEKDNVCASACIYLFGAGSDRLVHKNVWLGFHAARLSGGHVVTFNNLCDLKAFEVKTDQSKECDDFLVKMYETSMESTSEGLDLLESSGVSSTLRETYFLMDDDDMWYRFYNVVKKPDWVLWPDEAIEHNLATEVYSD